jgi:exosome complex RNA-binding protein Csl4
MYKNELENTIKQLKEIKPNQEWVSLLKSQILNPAEQKQVIVVAEGSSQKIGIMDIISGVLFQNKFAYATATLVFMIVGVFGFVNYTMPGDIFYPVKKIVEQVQPNSAVQVAYNRSEDLVKVVRENKTQNLTPAIDEYKTSVSDAVKNLTETLANNNDKKSVAMVLGEVLKLQENQKQLEVLGVNIGSTEEMSGLDGILATIVGNQIADFEQTTLTAEQQTELTKAKELSEQKKYSEALEVLLQMDNQL